MPSVLDPIVAEITALTTVVDGAVALLAALKAAVDSAPTLSAAQAIVNDAFAQREKLANAIVANTPTE